MANIELVKLRKPKARFKDLESAIKSLSTTDFKIKQMILAGIRINSEIHLAPCRELIDPNMNGKRYSAIYADAIIIKNDVNKDGSYKFGGGRYGIYVINEGFTYDGNFFLDGRKAAKLKDDFEDNWNLEGTMDD